MTKKTTEDQQLETWQIEDAARLKRLFESKKQAARDAGERFTQELFAEQNGLKSTAMVWQYLNGHRPLNIQAAAAFARGLRVKVSEFSPTLAPQIDQVAEAAQPRPAAPRQSQRYLQWIDDEEARLLSYFRATDDAGRSMIMDGATEAPVVLFDELARHKPKHGSF